MRKKGIPAREQFVKQPESVRLIEGIMHSAKFTDKMFITGKKESEETKIDICEALGRQHNIDILENLYQTAKKGMAADVNKRKAYQVDLEYWLKEMAEEVDVMLGCIVPPPSVMLGKLQGEAKAEYSFFTENIAVSPLVYEYFIPITLAHEYSHHVHDYSKYPLNWYFNEPLREGFCEALSVIAVKQNVKSNPRNNLVQAHEKIEKRIATFLYMHFNRRWHMRSGDYAVGLSAFAAAERRYGPKLYHDIIRERKPADMLVRILMERI